MRRVSMLALMTLLLALVLEARPALAAITTCNGLNATIIGTDADNFIYGTSSNDVIQANGGDDTVLAGGGNDLVCGNTEVDLVLGEGGDDEIYMGTGNDGGTGGEYGGAQGNYGWDKIFGFDGNDALTGGGGNDQLYGQNAQDELSDDFGSDLIDGGPPTGDTSTFGDDWWQCDDHTIESGYSEVYVRPASESNCHT